MKMKNKKAEQIAKKQLHLDERAAAKARRRGVPVLERQRPTRLQRERILIVCEGVNTEPSYFEKFRLSSATIEAVGEGFNTVSLVRRAQKLKEEDDYDQVWCVFDKDDFPASDFNAAIQLADQLGFGVAYSNQAFEYWLLLHFEDHQGGGLHRDRYGEKINTYLNKLGSHYDSDGSKNISDDIFDHLLANDPKLEKRRVDIAIIRAERIYNQYDHQSPAVEESSTTVFRLVKAILKYI